MKHTAVLLSLLAVAATAAKLPNAGTPDIVARHAGHHQPNNTIPGDGHNRDQDLEKRRGGGAGGGHSSGAGGAHGGSTGTTNYRTSGASVLMSLDVGLLVAGVTGAGIGAIFFL